MNGHNNPERNHPEHNHPEHKYTYDPEYVPPLFKLSNMGFLCYMNSLVQCIISLPSVNRSLLELQPHTKNPLVHELCKLISTKKSHSDSLPTYNLTCVFRALQEVCKESKLMWMNQEDAQECATLIIDSLGIHIRRHFEVRYSCTFACKCGIKRPAGGTIGSVDKQPSETMIDLSEDGLDTLSKVHFYISHHYTYPRGAKCDCGLVNDVSDNVRLEYSLRKINEVIIIYFKKYRQKTRKFFPIIMKFNATDGIYTYQAICQIDHYGTANGGHYTARCMRQKPNGYQAERDLSLQDKLTHQLGDQAREKLLKKLELWRSSATDPVDTFLLNDQTINYTGNLDPAPETYMVFYHLMRIDRLG